MFTAFFQNVPKWAETSKTRLEPKEQVFIYRLRPEIHSKRSLLSRKRKQENTTFFGFGHFSHWKMICLCVYVSGRKMNPMVFKHSHGLPRLFFTLFSICKPIAAQFRGLAALRGAKRSELTFSLGTPRRPRKCPGNVQEMSRKCADKFCKWPGPKINVL